MAETLSKIIPNSFSTPNFYVDECMSYLTGNEYKCLSLVARKTFGWQKRSDRIAKSQIMAFTGLGDETVDNSMTALVTFGLVIRVAENNASNDGVEWALQTDDSQVRYDLMLERQKKNAETNRSRTANARQKRLERGVGLLDNPTPEEPSVGQKGEGGGDVGQPQGGDVEQPGGGDVQHPPQKPIKAKEKKSMGAEAPARSPELFISERAAVFPKDCQEGAQLMQMVFNLIPPERPPANAPGGEFALWINGIRALVKLAAEYNVPLEQAMRLTYQRWNQDPFNLSHPGALAKTMTGVLAQATRVRTSETDEETALESKLKNFKPRS